MHMSMPRLQRNGAQHFNRRIHRHQSLAQAVRSHADFVFQSSLSQRLNLDLAVEEAVQSALAGASNAADADVALAFLSSAFDPQREYSQLVPLLRAALPRARAIVGCTGMGVIGGGPRDAGPREVEHSHALSLTLARLPGVSVRVTRVEEQDLPALLDAPPSAWEALVAAPEPRRAADDAAGAREGAAASPSAAASAAPAAAAATAATADHISFVVLADPTFTKLEDLTAGLDYAFPGAAVVGGLASAGRQGSARALFAWSLDQQGEGANASGVYRSGAVVLCLRGPVRLQLIVAQGCRPLNDRVYTVDALGPQPNLVVRVADARGQRLTPVEALQRDLAALASSKEDFTKLLSNLALGLAPTGLDTPQHLEPQDFLIRGCAFDRSGVMVVGDAVRVGQRYRFMVRDREGAQADLHAHGMAHKRGELAAAMAGGRRRRPIGALLFSCNGRGTSLYGEPDWDSRTLASYVPAPCAGFLCNGEIGKVGMDTKLHGFTCAIALVRPAFAGADAPEAAAGAAGAEAAPPGAGDSSDATAARAPAQEPQQEEPPSLGV